MDFSVVPAPPRRHEAMVATSTARHTPCRGGMEFNFSVHLLVSVALRDAVDA